MTLENSFMGKNLPQIFPIPNLYTPVFIASFLNIWIFAPKIYKIAHFKNMNSHFWRKIQYDFNVDSPAML